MKTFHHYSAYAFTLTYQAEVKTKDRQMYITHLFGLWEASTEYRCNTENKGLE